MATTVSNVTQLINAIKNIGGEIFLESGTYIFYDPITTSRACQLKGPTDRSAILKIASGQSWAAMAYMMRFNTTGNCSFEYLEMAGDPKTVKGAGYQGFVRVVGASSVLIDHCYCHDNGSDIFRLDGVDNITATYNKADHGGHEFIYMMYECGYVKGDPAGKVRIDIHDNDIEIFCNSAFRLSNGAYNARIYDNSIHSVFEGGSTGPGIEVDDGDGEVEFKNIEICNNDFYNLNGSGIWLLDRGSVTNNIGIHGNTFTKVGQFITRGTVYTASYNGYSNAGIAICGFNGVDIRDNVFKNLKYGIIQHEYKATLDFKYVANFNNNTIDGSVVGFRIDSSRGSIVGGGNTISNVKTYAMGVTGNVKLSDSPGPIENDEDVKEIITALVDVTDSAGKTGTQLLLMDTSQMPARDNGLALITCKLSKDGAYGSRNVEFPLNATCPETIQATTCTGTDLLVKVKLTRPNQESGTVAFILPTVAGSGENILKFRTADGRYGEKALNIVMVDPTPEPEPEPDPVIEPIHVKVSVENAEGWTGCQEMDIIPEQQDPRKYMTTLITTKLTCNGYYGNRNIEFMVDQAGTETVIDEACTGSNFLVNVELTRPSGEHGKVQFSIPTVAGTGYNVFKFRTPDGWYGEAPLNIVMVAPPEPDQKEVKKITHTLKVMLGDVELLNTVHVSDAVNVVEVPDGSEVSIIMTVGTDTGMDGEYEGTMILREKE